MALRKCKECGNRVSSRAKTCPQCGAPVKRKTHPLVGAFAFLIMIAVCAGVCAQVFNLADKTQQAVGPETQEEPRPHDDLSLFVSRYGPPDSEFSSESEVPRPPIVTRWLIYKQENLRAVYVPDAPVGAPPPCDKWKLFGFQNHKTDAVISPAEVVRLMAHRDRKKSP